MKLVGKLTNDIINQCIQHFQNDENKDKLKHTIIEPIIYYISDAVTERIYPYFIFLNTLFILTFILVITILIMMIFQRKK